MQTDGWVVVGLDNGGNKNNATPVALTVTATNGADTVLNADFGYRTLTAIDGFDGFDVSDRPALSAATMTQYDQTFPLPQAFPPFSLARILAEVKSGVAEATIAFEPTGEVILGAGEKGGKAVEAKLKKIVLAESERVTEEFRTREADEQRATEQKIEDLRIQMEAAIDAHREARKVEAENRKDEIRRARDEIEQLGSMTQLTETEFRYLDEKYGSGARNGRVFWAGNVSPTNCAGSGNVAQYSVEKVNQLGGTPITLSDSNGPTPVRTS